MQRGIMAAAAMGAILFTVALWPGRAQPPNTPDFSGDWELISASGTTPPAGLTLQIEQPAANLRIAAQWIAPANGQYGLTTVGLLSPRLNFSMAGREDLNQSGPFVVHSQARWEGARLVVAWRTSQYLGSGFRGRWDYGLSADGQQLTIDVHADSSLGQHADAVLQFQRRSA